MSMALYKAIILRDIRLSFKGASSIITLIMFFVLAASLFVFAVTDLNILPKIANAIIWVCSILSSMLAINSLYKEDFLDGTLEQLLIKGVRLESIVIAKIISHWIVTAVPLLLTSPILMVMLEAKISMFPSLLLGTILLSILSSVCACLTLETSKGYSIAELLILPLYIPVVIFGVNQYYQLLFALILLIFPISIFASRMAIISAIKT